MCVLIVKPAGVDIPSKEIIEAAHKANPHGCGLASPSVHYKGLNFKEFKKHLNAVSKYEPCIIHFRFATHGSICDKNCHPFKQDDTWFAHNGILDIEPEGDMTDSETAFKNIIYPTIEAHGIDSLEVEDAIDSVIGYSKFAILHDDELYLWGDFLDSDDGCFYSNLRFLPYLNDYIHNSRYFAF